MAIEQDLIDKFNAKWARDETTGCWNWTGAHLPKGYGIIKKPGERKQYYAHRLSYMIHKGNPGTLHILHSCDNPRCVNPEHLSTGTRADNQRDMKSKGRSLYGERNSSSKLTDQKVTMIRASAAAGVSQRQIAAQFGISQISVSRIVRRIRWAHLPAT